MQIEDLMLNLIQDKLYVASEEADSHSGDEDSYSIVTGIRDTLQKLHDELVDLAVAYKESEDIFVTFHADYDDYGTYYVGPDIHKAFEARAKLTSERTRSHTDVQVWRNGVYLEDLNSIEQYFNLSHPTTE